MISRYFRYQDDVVPNTAALAFIQLGHPLGVALLTAPAWYLKAGRLRAGVARAELVGLLHP